MKNPDIFRLADNFINLVMSQHFEYGVVSTTDLMFDYLPDDPDLVSKLINFIWLRSYSYGEFNNKQEKYIKGALLHAIPNKYKIYAVEFAYKCLHSDEYILQEAALNFLEMTNFPNTLEELKKMNVSSKLLIQYRDKIIEQLENENG